MLYLRHFACYISINLYSTDRINRFRDFSRKRRILYAAIISVECSWHHHLSEKRADNLWNRWGDDLNHNRGTESGLSVVATPRKAFPDRGMPRRIVLLRFFTG
jgi:hypothetical protein